MPSGHEIDIFRAPLFEFLKNGCEIFGADLFAAQIPRKFEILAEGAPKGTAAEKNCARTVSVRNTRFLVKVEPVLGDFHLIASAARAVFRFAVGAARDGAQTASRFHK